MADVPATPPVASGGDKSRLISVCLALAVITIAAFARLPFNDFVAYDDTVYVTQNSHVQGGLTPGSIVWAFTNTGGANFWHPLTWLSIMLDVDLFGLNPAGHHVSNLFLHILNTLLLFVLLWRMTGALFRSAFVAALFAVHPLHVESVAWVAQRKDTLSTLFCLLTLLGYARYVQRERSWSRYGLVVLLFALGLMAKPMLVTLPFMLLLLDYWPLGRGLRLKEKIPLFTLAALAAVIAYLAQRWGGTLPSLEIFPLHERMANAMVATAAYIGKMFWPVHLTCYYPHPGSHLQLWLAAAAAGALGLLTLWIMRRRGQAPYAVVGWLWYLGTLLPVSGLVQVGGHAMADRYSYVPLIGLFICVSWSLSDLSERWRLSPRMIGAFAVLILAALMARTSDQVLVWRDPITLMRHNVAVTPPNVQSLNLLGEALLHQDRYAQAIEQYRMALLMSPDAPGVHYNMANALVKVGRLDEGIAHYRRALRARDQDADVHNNMAIALARQGNIQEALRHYDEALRIDPLHAMARANRQSAMEQSHAGTQHFDADDTAFQHGVHLARWGNASEAIQVYENLLRRRPDLAHARYNLGVLYAKSKRWDDAAKEFSEALRLEPDFSEARRALDLVKEQ